MKADIFWLALGEEADRAATRCNYCGNYGHGATQCPELAHINKSGLSLESVRTDREFNRAFDVVLFVAGFAFGLGFVKLTEWLAQVLR